MHCATRKCGINAWVARWMTSLYNFIDLIRIQFTMDVYFALWNAKVKKNLWKLLFNDKKLPLLASTMNFDVVASVTMHCSYFSWIYNSHKLTCIRMWRRIFRKLQMFLMHNSLTQSLTRTLTKIFQEWMNDDMGFHI